MQKIIPNLWFDTEAKEAVDFYVSLFPKSKVAHVTTLKDTPSGDCDVVSFELWGHPFMAISAGPLFKFNPSISCMVNFDPSRDKDARKHLDRVWAKLSKGGKVLMPLDKYPFSERYGWIQDRYGFSWQLILTDPSGEIRPTIVPSLLFTGTVAGKAEEASDYYLSVFKHSKRGTIARYPAGMHPDKEGTLMFTDFQLGGQWFAAMDSAREHVFTFNEAVSLIVTCDSQEEVDHFWSKLSAYPENEQCGWCKDTYGVIWQVTPARMDEMMAQGAPEQIARVTRALLSMKKLDIAALEKSYKG